MCVTVVVRYFCVFAPSDTFSFLLWLAHMQTTQTTWICALRKQIIMCVFFAASNNCLFHFKFVRLSCVASADDISKCAVLVLNGSPKKIFWIHLFQSRLF